MKILIIGMIIIYLTLGVALLYYSKSNDLSMITFIALKVIGVFYLGMSFYLMYRFKRPLQ